MASLEEIKALYENMPAHPGMKKPTRMPPRRVIDVTNPGTSRPENLRTPRLSLTQTMSSTPTVSTTITSNGDSQRVDQAAGSKGVNVLHVPYFSPKKFNGEFQHRNLKPVNQGVTSTHGTGNPVPQDVSVAAQNLHRAPLHKVEERTPAKTVDAGVARPGGLATGFNIK